MNEPETVTRLTAPLETEIDYRRRWRYADIPRALHGQGLDAFEPRNEFAEQAKAAASELVDSLPERRKLSGDPTPAERSMLGVGMTLWGQFGSGKTSLACAILTDVHLRYDATIQYLYVPTYIAGHHRQASLDRDRELRDAEIIEYNDLTRLRVRARKVDVLVLDDLGQEDDHWNTGRKHISELVRHRFHYGRITVPTSNLAPADWQGYDTSLPSFAMQAMPPFSMGGDDLRAG